MRFKKLKIAVGVGLAIFILVTANIIIFGLLHGKDQYNILTPSVSNKNNSDPGLSNSQAQITTVQPSMNSPQMVMHQNMNTRAS